MSVKKVLASIASYALVGAVALGVGGTLATLTDEDSAVNTSELGNIDIELIEEERNDDGGYQSFTQNKPIYPASYKDTPVVGDGGYWTNVTGAIDKIVTVKNIGESPAYYRTIIAVEHLDDDKVLLNRNENDEITWTTNGTTTIDGTKYDLYVATYKNALEAGTVSVPSLRQVALSKDATSADVKQLGDKLDILVHVEACQTVNMSDDAAKALEEAFQYKVSATAHPWVERVEIVRTADELVDAIADGGMVVLTADIELNTVANFATIKAGADTTVNLNGYDITATLENESGSSSIFNVKKGATLTITGEGTVHAVADKTISHVSAIINNEAGNVIINGGTYTMEYGTYDEGYLIPTIVDNNTTLGAANLTINDGTFSHTRNMFRNFSNNKTAVATITINGGTFNGESNDIAYIWNQKPSANSPDGAGAINVNGGTFNYVAVFNDFTGNTGVTIGENVSVDVLNE